MIKPRNTSPAARYYSQWRQFILSHESAFKFMNYFHRIILKFSKGRLGTQVLGMPVITLITTGRSSGLSRHVLLTSPVQEDNKWLLVASKGGAPEDPQWYRNLRANPQVEAILPGKIDPQKFLAHIVDESEYARYWRLTTKKYRGYASYQQRTERKIPLVLLEPA